MSLVSIRDVRKSFGANEVLKGVSLDIAKGDVVAIIGRSGSGKSTLLRCINGLETYQSGTITADGIEVGGLATNLRELRRHVGMVFQQFNLFPHLTAAENVMLAPTVGFSVQVVKGTALASIIGFVELTKAGTMLNNATFRPFVVYSLVALIYFCLCFPLSWWAKKIEGRLNVAR